MLRSLLSICAALIAFAVSLVAEDQSLLLASEKPNVLVIVTDDQGWADIGYNNPGKVYTPNMDQLAKTGATLVNHYVMSQCTPTRLALFTGRYPGRFGISGLAASNKPLIPYGTLTMASLLKANGYDTAITGKWHMGSWQEHGPNHHGFDYSYGALTGAVGAYDHRYRAGSPNEVTWHRNLEVIQGLQNGEHVTDLVTREAIKFIEQERGNPFFLYLPYFAPHTPLDERDKKVKLPTQLNGDNPTRWVNEGRNRWFNDPQGVIQQETDVEKRLFLAVLHHLDDSIGKVIQALEETGQRENTIVFLTSDNGPQINWPGGAYPSDLKVTDINQSIPFRGSKSTVYEGGMRVPGVINWQGKIAASKIETVTHIVDWLPTVAALTGAELAVPKNQPRLDGLDLSRELLGLSEGNPDPRELYHTQKRDQQALRLGNWKLVKKLNKDSEVSNELFNLAEDPAETTDLAASNPSRVKELSDRLQVQRSRDKNAHNFVGFEGTEQPLSVDTSQAAWYEQYKTQKNILEPATMLLNREQEPELTSGFEPIFNGVDLKGWTSKGGACEFEVKDNCIVGTCIKGSKSTYLCTDNHAFGNFIFTCDMFWEVDGNSGVMFRARERIGKGNEVVVYGPQVEMEEFSKDRNWSGGIYGQSCGGYWYPLWLKQHVPARAAMKEGEWNRVTLKADGNQVKTWVNGIPTAFWIDKENEFPSGFIGLQVHSGKQGKILWKNLRVKPL